MLSLPLVSRLREGDPTAKMFGQRKDRMKRAISSLFFEAHGSVAVGGEPDFAAFDFSHEGGRDEVVMALVAALAAVGLDEFDTVALDGVDGPDMDAVGADHFHMLLDAADVSHCRSPRAEGSASETRWRREWMQA